MSIERNYFVLKDYVAPLSRNWPIVLVMTTAFLVISILLLLVIPEEYETESSLLITPSASDRIRSGSSESDVGSNEPGIGLSIEAMYSLTTSPDILNNIAQDLNRNSELVKKPYTIARLQKQMRARIETAGVPGSQVSLPLITMTVRDENSNTSQLIVTSWQEHFVEKITNILSAEASETLALISSQIQKDNELLTDLQSRKAAFLKQFPLESMRSEAKVVNAQYEQLLTKLSNDLTSMTDTQARLRTVNSSIASISPVVVLKRSLSEDAISSMLSGPNPPTSLSSFSFINEEKNQVYYELLSQQTSLRITEAALVSSIDDSRTRSAQLKLQIDGLVIMISNAEAGNARINREIIATESDVVSLTTHLNQGRLSITEQEDALRVVQSPILSDEPIGPNKFRFLFLAGLAGLILGLLVSYAVYYANGFRKS